MTVQHRDFIATDIINPRLESFRDKFRLHEIHPAWAKTVSFRATVLLFAVSVPFQPRPARFERNEESDGPLGRRRGRRRPRKLVVSIRVWDAARTLDSRSFVRFFFFLLILPIVEESLDRRRRKRYWRLSVWLWFDCLGSLEFRFNARQKEIVYVCLKK